VSELEVVRPVLLEHARPAGASTAQLLVAAFLVEYSGRTREAYASDLRQWWTWCGEHAVEVLEAQRPHVTLFARELEEAGRAAATVARKLSAVAGFYGYCVVEGAIAKSPAAHVRRPKVSDESPRFGLDRDELGRLVAAAAAAGPVEHALVCLLALNGLRVTEACRARASDLSLERGHQLLAITRKGGKQVVVPLAARTSAALAALERAGDELLLGCDRFAAWRLLRGPVHAAGITKPISPHSLRHTFCTLGLDAGVDLLRMQVAMGHADARTTLRYDRARRELDDAATHRVAALLDDGPPPA
jgi:integrase/recombinase XerD